MLQFQVSELFGIVIKLHGMAIAEPEGLRLAFHEADETGKWLDAKVDAVLLAWDNLADFQVDHGLLGDQVRIAVHSTESLKQLPGVQQQTLTLQTRKRDRESLEAFAKEVAEFRAGRRTEDVEEMLDDIRDFLHGS